MSKWFLGKLGRVTTSGKLIAEIDGLRFIAILSVVLYHAIGHFFTPPAAGQLPLCCAVLINAVLPKGHNRATSNTCSNAV